MSVKYTTYVLWAVRTDGHAEPIERFSEVNPKLARHRAESAARSLNELIRGFTGPNARTGSRYEVREG